MSDSPSRCRPSLCDGLFAHVRMMWRACTACSNSSMRISSTNYETGSQCSLQAMHGMLSSANDILEMILES